ncbi:MAG: biotin/lipoyl-binding protein [Dehalococcoidia bacterium]
MPADTAGIIASAVWASCPRRGKEALHMSSRSESLTAPLGRRRARFGGIGPWQGAILVGLLVLAAAGGYALFTRLVGDGRRPAPTFTEATVGRQTVTSFVNASGTVATTRQVKISPYAGGRITRLAVKQGDSVVEGQEVAVMDTVPLELKRDTTRSQLEAARIRLQALLNGNTVADIATQQQAVATAQAALTRAQSDYSNLFTAVNADDIAAAQASLDRAKAALDVAQTNYDKLSNGVDLTLRPEWSALQTAKNDYQTAVSNYNNRTAAPQAYEVAAARAAVASGQSAVTAAEAKLAQVQTPNPSDVSSARSAVASAEAQLESARQKYAGLVIGGNLAERQAAQASLDAAQLALAAAERRGATGTTDADLSNAQAAIARARADVQTAQNNLNRISGQPSGVDLTAAEQGVQAAQTALTTARNNLDKLLNPLPARTSPARNRR